MKAIGARKTLFQVSGVPAAEFCLSLMDSAIDTQYEVVDLTLPWPNANLYISFFSSVFSSYFPVQKGWKKKPGSGME